MMSIRDAITIYLHVIIVEFNAIACQLGHLLHSGTYEANGVSRIWHPDRKLSASHR